MGYSLLMNDENRDKVRNRLKRIGGQVAGLQKMVEEDRYCVDILTASTSSRSSRPYDRRSTRSACNC
jgi:DNA-binding FrmR family transcriptional regulator